MTVADPGGEHDEQGEAAAEGEAALPPPASRRDRVAAVVLCAAIATAGALVSGAVYVRPSQGDSPPRVVTVSMAGSDPFLAEPAVQAVFRRHGLQIQQTSMGSLQILGQPSLATGFDMANTGSYDAGQLVQQKLRNEGATAQVSSSYSSPIVIVTYQPIVRLLETIGLVKDVNGILIFNVKAYLKRVVKTGMRWISIRGNRAYPSENRVLVWTTEPEYSNSGAMFAAIVSSAQLSDDPVTSVQPSGSYLTLARECFTEQGSMPSHTPDLLEQFLADGMSTYPMAVVYENDYILTRLGGPADLPPGLAVMYPTPTVVAANTLVSWTNLGQRVTELLAMNPTLISLEEQDGYRTSHDNVQFVRYLAARGIRVPNLDMLPEGLQIATLPTDSVLQALAQAVDHG